MSGDRSHEQIVKDAIDGLHDDLQMVQRKTASGQMTSTDSFEKASLSGLRAACAASGLHDHDGCSCSENELIRRALRSAAEAAALSMRERAADLVEREDWISSKGIHALPLLPDEKEKG